MRQKRAKAYRKLMHLYSMSFGFRQPYQILVDSEMCKTATMHKLDVVKQLGSVLQGETKPMITQCCIHELYLQGKTQQPSVDLAKEFERRKCNHREPIPGDECLLSVVGDKNKHRYVIATQSQPLRVKLRSIPATPIVHINRSVMVLEPPSDVTLKTKEMAEEQALHATAPEMALVKSSKPEEAKPKKRKGPKGPNPLSVKKKKTGPEPFAKNKGKTREQGSRSAIPGGEDKSRAGEKRKRAENEDGEEHGNKGHEEENVKDINALEDQGASKKRKRRRKAKQVVVNDEGGDSSD